MGLGLLIYNRGGRESVEPTVNKIEAWFGCVWIWKHGIELIQWALADSRRTWLGFRLSYIFYLGFHHHCSRLNIALIYLCISLLYQIPR